jgi:hypothetical protein
MVKFPEFLGSPMYLVNNATTCFSLTDGHFQGALKFFLLCAVYGSTYLVGILHMIKIIIMNIKCYISYDQYCG